jgi:hypothetical protein
LHQAFIFLSFDSSIFSLLSNNPIFPPDAFGGTCIALLPLLLGFSSPHFRRASYSDPNLRPNSHGAASTNDGHRPFPY